MMIIEISLYNKCLLWEFKTQFEIMKSIAFLILYKKHIEWASLIRIKFAIKFVCSFK